MKRAYPKVLLSLIFFLSILSVTQNARAMLIVQNGAPKATIVVADDASAQVKQAAQTLQQYVEQSSGAKLPIASSATGASIEVGQSVAAKKAGVDTSKLDQDGFVLQGVGANNFIIIGGSDWGTEFGVYDFLERYVGVRWLIPGDTGIDVPSHSSIDIPATKVVQQPTYLSRQLSPFGSDGDTPGRRWARFNRAKSNIVFSHNLLNIFPVSKFGKTHPEFYPMINGKRYIPTSDKDYGWEPNLSAPGIVDAAVQQIDEYFQKHPDATYYSLGMNDSQNWDQSPESLARRSGKKNYLGMEDISDDYFTWANAVVEKVLLKYPDKWFGTLAYNGLAEPPTKVSVNPRIVPFITYDRMRWGDPKIRQQGQELTERWAAAAPVIGWYDYAYGMTCLLPRVYFHRVQQYLSWGAAHHVKFHYAELYPNWGTGPKAWVYAKLLWNPNQDVDALLDDWYTHFAGPKAAPKLKDYYAIWEKFWSVDIFKSKFHTDKYQYMLLSTEPRYLMDVPKSDITRADADMNAALQLADTPLRKARVAEMKKMWEYFKITLNVYQAANSSDYPQSEKQALTFLDKAADVMTQVKKREEMREELAKDPLYKDTAGYLTSIDIAGARWGESLIWRVLPWAEKYPSVKTKLQTLTQSSDADVAAQASKILQAASGKVTLVSTNGSFEEGVKDWNVWDKGGDGEGYHKGQSAVSTDKAHSGTHSLMVQGMERGAAIQTIPYQAGNYIAKAYVYAPSASNLSAASLTVGATGDGAPANLLHSDVPLRPGVWSSVVVPFSLPELKTDKPGTLRFMLVVDGLNPDTKIYIDDVEIYKLNP